MVWAPGEEQGIICSLVRHVREMRARKDAARCAVMHLRELPGQIKVARAPRRSRRVIHRAAPAIALSIGRVHTVPFRFWRLHRHVCRGPALCPRVARLAAANRVRRVDGRQPARLLVQADVALWKQVELSIRIRVAGARSPLAVDSERGHWPEGCCWKRGRLGLGEGRGGVRHETGSGPREASRR